MDSSWARQALVFHLYAKDLLAEQRLCRGVNLYWTRPHGLITRRFSKHPRQPLSLSLMSLQLNVMWGDGWPQPSPHTNTGLWDCMSDTVLHLVGRGIVLINTAPRSAVRQAWSRAISQNGEYGDGWGRKVRGPLGTTLSFSLDLSHDCHSWRKELCFLGPLS